MMVVKRMGDKILHTVWLAMLLVAALILILFAHAWLSPELVYTGMISGLASIVAMRLAANGYNKPGGPNAQ